MFGLVGDNPVKIVTSGETSLFWVQPIGKRTTQPDRSATRTLIPPPLVCPTSQPPSSQPSRSSR